MFYSQLLLSKKGPLGTIWLAAHFHKRLKKDQINQTNIPSSVDKILHDEVAVFTYRILGFLLLGVVRIYSKKVEYLFHDCRDVLTKLGDSPSGKRAKLTIESLCTRYPSITIPESFELDAFNLGVLEDPNLSSDRSVRSHEEIMLPDARNKGETRLGSFNKYLSEENLSYSGSHSAAYTPVRDVLSPGFMDIDMDVNLRQNKRNLDVGPENLLESRFFLEERLEPMTFDIEEEPNINRPSSIDLETGEHFSSQMGAGMNVMEEQPDINRPSGIDLETGEHFSGQMGAGMNIMEEQPVVITSIETGKHIEAEKTSIQEVGLSESSKHHGPKEFSASTTVAVNTLVDTGKKHIEAEKISLPEATSSESRKHQGTKELSASMTVDVTPQSKLRDHPADDAPEVVAVNTPAAKDRTRSWSKRCLSDENVVVPNKIYKHWIGDSSGLVCKRRKAPHTAFHAWKAQKISNLPQSFLEPLIPFHLGTSLNARDLIGIKVIRSQEPSQTAPLKDHACSTSTPLAHSTSVALAPHEVEEVEELGVLEPATPMGSIENARSLIDDQDQDQELDLSVMDEVVNSYEADDRETLQSSERTRAVAGYLYRQFELKRQQQEDEVINLSQLSMDKTKKESARLFYEILVLKTRSCVDVRQDIAYGDILVKETPGLKQTFEAEAAVS